MEIETEEEKLKNIKARFNQLESERERFIPRWIEAQQYVAPSVLDWTNYDAIPEIPKRFSSAPCNYLNTLTNGLIGYSISPHIIYFKLSLENQKLLDSYGVKDWLENVETIMYAEFNRSNLYKEATKFVQDAAVIGHGTMLIEEDLKNNKLHFSTIRPNEIFLDIDNTGEVDTVFRKFLMPIKSMVDFFGLDNLDENIKEDYKHVEKWNEKIEILFCVYPRKNYNSEHKNSINKPFAAVYVDLKHNKIIQEGGYDELPYAVFEWQQINGFAYSESPAIGAMTEIKTLNIAEKTRLHIAQTSAEPPLRISPTVKTINLVPKGRNYIDNEDIIEPIKTGENYPITLEIVESIKNSIKDFFHVDFFLMLQQKQGQMTATEVMELQGEKAAILSNLIVAENAALQKIIQRSFNLLMKSGKLPPPPQSIIGQSAAMKIDFVGPLAQSQKKYHTMGGITQALSVAGGIMQIFPNALDYIDADALIKRALEGQGMPQAIIRETEDVEKIREERLKAQQMAQMQAQQQQMAQELMQNMDKMSKPIEQGSYIDTLNKQMTGALS